MNTAPELPEYAKLPPLLQQYPAWILWCYRAQGRAKPAKVPVSPITFHNCSAFEKKHQLSLQAALDLASSRSLGVGLVLTGDQIETDAGGKYLIGLDFDDCDEKLTELKKLWKRLGKPYVEVSPSGNGLRMFALCRRPLTGGNCGGGRELYSSNRFLTVTGNPGLGTITDQTESLVALHDEWFPKKVFAPVNLVDHSFPENEVNRQRLLEALSNISADCPYQKYRNICWAIFSTGWHSALDIARAWSLTAPHRYDEGTLETLYRTFDTSRVLKPTIGTIFYYARNS